MKDVRLWFAAAVVVLAAGLLPAQNYAPPAVIPPDKDKLKTITERADKIGDVLSSLRRRGGIPDGFLVEVEIYQKAAEWVVRHNEFYHKDSADWALDVVDRGLLRAAQLSRGDAAWHREIGHAVVRAYRSRLDGSVQPYAVTFPKDFGKDVRKRYRLDVVLHGRDSSLTEVKFLHQHTDQQAAPPEQTWVQLDIYGRGNNAYRWAGERDVEEALESFVSSERAGGRDMIDLNKSVLRGFSMGGAGTWHLGLHHPSNWCLLGPGAGFSATHGYVKDLPDPLPPYQEACLHIYDAVDYAENAFDVPVVAYAGENDPQLEAAKNIEAKLKPLGIPMTLLVAPGLKHEMPAEWRAKAEEQYQKYTGKGRPEYPSKVRFVTWTSKYNVCDWVEVLGLEQHYRRSLVDAAYGDNGYTVKTANVRLLHIALEPTATQTPTKVAIDGDELEVRPYKNTSYLLHIYLERQGGHWHAVLPEKLLADAQRRLMKHNGLQGPIDDAFTYPFLCVKGSGKTWHEGTQKYADACLKRFVDEWDKYFRGELEVKEDTAVTPEDLRDKQLILFGDPASNSLIAQALDMLPLGWTKERITLAGKSFAAAEHVPALIYPSPFHTGRYVVLNSGHTFHAADFQGTNALLYPRLGDYAILKPTPTEKDPAAATVELAGLFDDSWRTEKK
jgi:predicted esterase